MDKSRKPNLIISSFAFAAFAVSVYILVAVKSHRVLYGCGPGGCHEILAGRWERWGPLPVSTLGIFGYLALMAGTIFTLIPQFKRSYKMVWNLMAIESVVGLRFILWLVFLQGAVIKHYCIYCMTSHFFGTVAYLTTLVKVPIWRENRPHTAALISAGSLPMLAVMIAVHIFAVPDMHASQDAADIEYSIPADSAGGMIHFGQPEQTSREVHLLNNRLNFDIYKMPVIGPRTAKYVLLELSDYNCPSCRKLSARLEQFSESYDLDFCVVYLPTPYNSSCNPNVKKTPRGFRTSCELARIALAVNLADQSKFREFHEFMMHGSRAPEPDAAKKKAEELVGKEELAKALKRKEIDQWIATATGVQSFIKAKTIPRLITKDHVGRSRRSHRPTAGTTGCAEPRQIPALPA